MALDGLIAHHQLVVTVAVAFLAGLGLPMPVSVVLLVAGASAHAGRVPLDVLLPSVWLASLSGDTILYLGGRFTGWSLLAWLCRLTTNPEECIFASADYFYRRGPNTLLVAKFIPGLGSMAAPLAGSLNMRLWRFLRLDAAGTVFYTTTWILVGFLFSRSITEIERGVGRAGHFALGVLLFVVLAYCVSWIVFSIKARRFRGIERVAASDLYERLQQADPDRLVIIADVRSHGYYDPGMQRIKNSIRVEPHRLREELLALREFMAPECEIYLYCSCIREATSVRVAYMMEKENCRTQVIDGGLRAWVKAGGEVEPVPEIELQRLPRFD